MVSDLRCEVIVRFVDISEMVDQPSLFKFSFHTKYLVEKCTCRLFIFQINRHLADFLLEYKISRFYTFLYIYIIIIIIIVIILFLYTYLLGLHPRRESATPISLSFLILAKGE